MAIKAPSAATIDFFQSQEAARKKTSLLVIYFVLAVVLIIVAVYLAFVITLVGLKPKLTSSPDTVGLDTIALWQPSLFAAVMAGTIFLVICGSLYKISQLAQGGKAVAVLLGGRPLNRNTRDMDELKVLNVVEEMAIASGTPVPPVYLLDQEDGINAFAAGFSPKDAVIGVTRGCIAQLSRDELQGVVAHEFSHILNGDMRLNLRLIGILHGILLIGIVGYWIMRTTLRSGGSRSKGKGGGAAIAILGLIIMVIGYVGVFFGKLIKSAVSRQREFLADASGVQFTRNPSGLAGALMKIAGYANGSRLLDSHAEEASHFFFCNGLASSFLNLMSTHPPIEERIKRLEPSFADSVQESSVRSADRSSSPPAFTDAMLSVVSSFQSPPERLVANFGSPASEHLDYAVALLSQLPPKIASAAREPFGATVVVYCLLLNQEAEPRRLQLERLAKGVDAASFAETQSLATLVAGLTPQFRLPLAELAILSLKELSAAQYRDFRQNVRGLVEADNAIDLFEYTLQHMILRHLAPVFENIPRRAVRYMHMKPVLQECATLLSCLAYWGNDTLPAAEAAFRKGAQELGTGISLALAPVNACGLDALDRVLTKLAEAAPLVKKTLLGACSACVRADSRITLEEAELFRAVADSLECPVPPLLPTDLA